jgi:glutamine amidotransferase
MIAIIDYGMGNLHSVQKAFEFVGADARISQKTGDILSADKVVLPGVGAMKPAMQRLEELGLVDAIKKVAQQKKPFLGICLGMQLLFQESEEGGKVKGLGILSGTVKKFTGVKVPHIGWNRIKAADSCPLFSGLKAEPYFYFCHSYYCQPVDDSVIAAKTDYGVDFVSAVCGGNIMAVQFHPEKSQKLGLQVLTNFSRLK